MKEIDFHEFEYRIVKTKDGRLSLFHLSIDKNGDYWFISSSPKNFTGETEEDLNKLIETAKKALEKGIISESTVKKI